MFNPQLRVHTGPSGARDEVKELCEGFGRTTLLGSDAEFETAYSIGDELGRGGWATVFSARRRRPVSLPSSDPLLLLASATDWPPPATASDTADGLAVKVMNKNVLGGDEASRELAKRRMRDECRVLAELWHPHLIRMVEVCESPQCLFIVMERAVGGALLDRVLQSGAFSERHAQHVMRQLVDVLGFMHSHGVIHRDIKPENILLRERDSWEIAVSDFGLAKIFSQQPTLASSLPAGLASSLRERHAPRPEVQDAAGSAIDEALNIIAAAAAAGTRLEGSARASDLDADDEAAPLDLALGAGCSVDAGARWMQTSSPESACGGAPEAEPSQSQVTRAVQLLAEYTRQELEAGGHGLEHCNTRVGSPFYRAPEQVYCLPPYPTTYSTGVDVWSAGVVLYVLLGANLPFNESAIPRPPFSPAFATTDTQPAKVLLNAHSFPAMQFDSVSEEAKAVINEMLVVDPRRRPSAASLLRHSWLQPEAFGKDGLPAEVKGGSPERLAGSLATSYKESMRNLIGAAKRAREADSERMHATVGGGSVGSSVFGSCSFRDGASAMALSQLSRHIDGSVGREHARKLHEPKAARHSPHRAPEANEAEDAAARAGLGFFRPFGTTDAVSVDAGSTSERDPPHPGVDVLDL